MEFFQNLKNERKFQILFKELDKIREDNPKDYYIFKIHTLKHVGKYRNVLETVNDLRKTQVELYKNTMHEFIIPYIESLVAMKNYEQADIFLKKAHNILQEMETSRDSISFSIDLTLMLTLFFSGSSQYDKMDKILTEEKQFIQDNGSPSQCFSFYNFSIIYQLRIREFDDIESNFTKLKEYSNSNDKNRFHYLLTRIEYMWDYNLFEETLPLLEEMEEIATDFGSNYCQFYVYNYKGIHFARTGDFQIALKSFQKCLNFVDDNETPRKIGILINIGITYAKLGDFSNAISYFKIVEELNDDIYDQFFIYDNLGVCYLELGNFDESLKYLDKSIELKLERNTPNLLIYSYIHKSRVMIELGRFEEAVKFALECNEINSTIGSIDQQVQINTILGDILLKKGLIQEAFSYLDQSYKQLQKVDDPFLSSKLMIKLGEYYYNVNKIEEAKELFSESRKLTEDLDNKLNYARVLYEIYTFYQKIGLNEDNDYYLNQALQISKNHQHLKLTAQIERAVAEQYFIQGNLKQARSFLTESIKIIEDFENSEEMNKSLQLFAIIAIEEEAFDEAIDLLQQIITGRRNFNNPILIAETYLYLIIVDLRLEHSEKAKERLIWLEKLKIKTDYFLINEFYLLSHALYLIHQQTIKELAQAQILLEQLISDRSSHSYIKLLAEKHLFNLLLLDYRFNQNADLIDSLLQKTKLMYDHGKKEKNYSLIITSQIFEFKLYYEIEDRSKMLEILLNAKSIVENNDLNHYESKIIELEDIINENNNSSETVNQDRVSYDQAINVTKNLQYLNNNINQIFHSTPRLSVLFYLLPREDASFKDLTEVTGLTPGNLDRHCKKLVKAGFVEKFKKFVDDRVFTFYRITKAGIIEYRKYREDLKKYLDVQLI